MGSGLSRSSGRRGILIGGALALAALGARSARASLSDNLQGFVEITSVQSETDGVEGGSLRQQYTGHWSKQVVPYVTARASFRYLRLDIRSGDFPDVTREEWQPSGEVLWKHPQFSFGTTARRRNQEADFVAGRRVSDNVAMTFTTRSLVHPRLSLRYDWDHIFNRAAASELETRDQRIQAQLDHTLRRHTFLYSYTHRKTENVVTEIKSTEDAQVFRYESPIFRPGKLTASTTYTFNHRDQAQERVGGGKILTVIPGAAGLYAEDTSPEFDPLGNVPSLTDLNTADPTVPPIDIGGALIFRNLGLDLGFEQPVTVIYVYTDRPSGLQPSWDVFVSRDNLEWDVWEGTPTVTFNADLSRYEIAFPTVATRFVKVVNTGGNEIPEVLVTELEGLAEAELEGKVTRRGSGHRLDLGANYDFTERVSSSLDASYEYDPFSGFSGDRQRGDYTLGAEYRMTRAILHHLRWQQGYHSFADNTVEELNRTASYTLLVEPIETLRFTTSLDSRLGHRNGAKTGEFRGVVFRVFGTPVRRANLSADVNRSRTEQHDVGRLQDTWNFRISGDGAVTRSLNAILTYSHQRVTSQPGNELRVRNRYSINFDWRATRTIFARGTYNLVRELTDETSQDYLLSWNVAPKLALSGQGTFLKTQQDKYTERYNANLTYNLTARSTVYSSYTFTDFTQVGGVESVSFQLGLRAAL